MKKTALGHFCNWRGYLVDCPRAIASLTPEKQQLVHEVLRRLACPNTCHSLKYVEQAAGRLNRATMINFNSRPYLFYIFQWVTAMQRRAKAQHSKAKQIPRATITNKTLSRAPATVTRAAVHALRILSTPSTSQPAQRYEQIPTIAATDAGANEQGATRGGWFSLTPEYNKSEVRWFTSDITLEEHPWAYEGSPQSNIASVELCATLCLFQQLAHASKRATLSIPMSTDNKGNAYGVSNMKSKKPTAAAILAAIAELQQATGCRLRLIHTHREHNTWADQLTHQDTTGFNHSLQLQVTPPTIHMVPNPRPNVSGAW